MISAICTPCGCSFLAGTPVVLWDGSTRPIETLHPGDHVLTRNEQTGAVAAQEISQTVHHPVPAVVELGLSDGSGHVVERLTCSPEHPFFVVGEGWVAAGALGLGSSILTRAGPCLTVCSLEWQRAAGGYTVYNFTVSGDHTYFVGEVGGGAWVHNIDCDGVNLSQERLVHIVDRHWPTSGWPNTGKFNPGTRVHALINLIEETFNHGARRPNTLGRPGVIHELRFPDSIGIAGNGNAAYNLRLITNAGEVISAFPF